LHTTLLLWLQTLDCTLASKVGVNQTEHSQYMLVHQQNATHSTVANN